MDAGERLLHAIYGTEDQDAEKVRRLRAMKALGAAPELVEHLRAMLTPSDGRTEGGVLPEMRTPLLTGITDAADEVYVVLLEWVGYWSETLDIPAPLAAVVAWRLPGGPSANIGGPRIGGFRAGTSPTAARVRVRVLVAWLLRLEIAIARDPLGGEFFDEVSRIVWKYRASSGLTDQARSTRIWESSPRPCPDCGEISVRAEYFGEPIAAPVARGENLLDDVAGVQVRCMVCGWAEQPRASKVVRWLR
jgi:hypothetical protein